jgi:hypothetical protein
MSAAGICISVIDEAQNGTPQSTYDTAWSTLRSNYPEREFWLLQPGGPSRGTLKVPTAYTNDPIANGPIAVNRDEGNDTQRSDWFNICDLGNEPSGSVISVFIDTSGSMRLSTVQSSYDQFKVDCASAGIEIVFDTQSGGERWIIPHDKDIPPSANFSVEDSPISLGSGEEATLVWLVFGDVTSASIDQGIGSVTAEPSGSIKVQPLVDTTYTLTAIGPAGTTTRTVTVEVTSPPLPTIDTFSISPSSLIYPLQSTGTWSVSGILISDVSMTWAGGSSPASNIGLSGNQIIDADASGDVTLTVTNPSGSISQTLFLNVYQPVVATIFADPNPIPTIGSEFELSWDVSGSADAASIDPAVTSGGNVLLEGEIDLAITQSTTYTLSASGPGGSDTASISVIVYQFPTLTATFPATITYGQQYNLPISYDFATNGVTIELRYYERDPTDGTLSFNTQTSTLSGTVSDEFTGEITASYTTNIPWGVNGPFKVEWYLTAGGQGGTINTNSALITCIIDREPSAFTLPVTDNVFPETDPVSSPPIDIAISDPIIINNVDISVEIRSDEPIQVRFDDDDPDFDTNWYDLRELLPSTNTPPE